MTIKNQKYLHLAFAAAGIALLLIFAFTNDGGYGSGLLCGMGSSLTVIGVLQMIKLRRLTSNPEKAADYEISQKDERLQFLAHKARSAAFVISLYAQLAAGLIAQFVFQQKAVCMALCFAVCFQSLLYTGLYYYFAKKY